MPAMSDPKRRRRLGIALIVAGVLFLMVSNHVLLGWGDVWPVFPLLVGAQMLRVSRTRRAPWLVFSGVTGLLLGLFFLLFTLGFVGWERMASLWPVFALVAGVALIAESVVRSEGTLSLLAGASIVVFGVLAWMLEARVIQPRVATPFVRFWPLALVLAGVVLLKVAPRSARPERDPDLDAVREVLAEDEAAAGPDPVPPGLADTLAERVRSAPDADAAIVELVHGLKANFPSYAWVGVYRLEGDHLTLRESDYVGASPEHRRIAVGEGICGAAVEENRTLNVPDVCADPRYLACSPTVKSEIVVPIRHAGRTLGVLDIDSDLPAAFTAEHERFLEDLVGRVASCLDAGAPADSDA